jgi:predicted enzyme related to lactoylglutathione lyase
MGKGTTYNTVGVPSVDEFLKKIVKAGGKIVQKKTTIPGVGYMAYCADTEGNVFGIMQDDPTAK